MCAHGPFKKWWDQEVSSSVGEIKFTFGKLMRS